MLRVPSITSRFTSSSLVGALKFRNYSLLSTGLSGVKDNRIQLTKQPIIFQIQQRSLHNLSTFRNINNINNINNNNNNNNNKNIKNKIYFIQRRNLSGLKLKLATKAVAFVGAAIGIVIVVAASSFVIVFLFSIVAFIFAAGTLFYVYSKIGSPLFRRMAKMKFGEKYITKYYNRVDAYYRINDSAFSVIEKDGYLLSRLGGPIRVLKVGENVQNKVEIGSKTPLQIIDIEDNTQQQQQQEGGEEKIKEIEKMKTQITGKQTRIQMNMAPAIVWRTSINKGCVTAMFPVGGERGVARVAAVASKCEDGYELTDIRLLFDNWERYSVMQHSDEILEPDYETEDERKEREEKDKKN